jgi:hypothetical protein
MDVTLFPLLVRVSVFAFNSRMCDLRLDQIKRLWDGSSIRSDQGKITLCTGKQQKVQLPLFKDCTELHTRAEVDQMGHAEE